MDGFADALLAVTTCDGETWILAERLFSGFPAPDTFMVVFLDVAGRVIAAADLACLPSTWTLSPTDPLAR